MIERLHHQLKAALMCHADERWTKALPLVQLGIPSVWKEEMNASSAKLVYGSPLRLPQGNSLPPTSLNVLTSLNFLPGWECSSHSFDPYQHCDMLHHPRSFLKNLPMPHMSFYRKAPSGDPPSPVCRPMQDLSQGREDLFHRVSWCGDDSLHRPTEAGICPTCKHRIRLITSHSFKCHNLFRTAWMLSGLPRGVDVSAGGLGWWTPPAWPPRWRLTPICT
jgi:hypothetical protein